MGDLGLVSSPVEGPVVLGEGVGVLFDQGAGVGVALERLVQFVGVEGLVVSVAAGSVAEGADLVFEF